MMFSAETACKYKFKQKATTQDLKPEKILKI
jgi:hypothetical protein